MFDGNQEVNGRVAPLRNITLLNALTKKAMERPSHLPGLVCFSGRSGDGKSFAAAAIAGQFRAYYVEVKETWTKKAFLLAILRQMGIVPGAALYQMLDQVAEQLALSGRPLIIDEMDHVVARNMIELVRDIYEASQSPIVLIGEELLPQKLVRHERFHGRILDWSQAQPSNIDDARSLARLYCGGITVEDDLLARLVRETAGSTRRICVNLERVRQKAAAKRLKSITLAEWGDEPFFTGQPPKNRSF
jgi:DNA transposition AAA+ family ATPase